MAPLADEPCDLKHAVGVGRWRKRISVPERLMSVASALRLRSLRPRQLREALFSEVTRTSALLWPLIGYGFFQGTD
jgi:hypothetical protein